MSWQAAALAILGLVLASGFVWFERSRPPARIVAAVAAMAALGVAGRLVLAPIPNLVATTDVALLAGYSLGAGPGFAVGALSGLVSNFWLGQGPWTPWQMAGWGMVGIGGAALARLGGHRFGRLGLAGAAALAGLAYGALLDLSVMVQFGGEQSLDRYLALAARGLPFNIAHAAGNFVLMLAAGPALVRMLDRYRGRFEHRWGDAPLGRAAASLALLACLLAPLLVPQRSDAASGRDGARGWIRSAQNDDGGFGAGIDVASSTDMTGWAMVGLAAAGVNPRDVARKGSTPVEYLRRNADSISSIGDLELTILGLEASGLDARAFAGRDLVAELRAKRKDDGSFQRQVNLTAFAILAQRAAGVDGANVGAPAAWLRSTQNRNGGWGSVPGAESEPDSTGSALQALAVAPGKQDPIAAGAAWLKRGQRRGGGWSLTAGAKPNSQSTAWAIQGLAAAGISPGGVRSNGSSGADFLLARQSADGHIAYSAASDQTPVWVTAQGLTGLAKQPFPIAAVPRQKPDEPGGGGSENDSTGGSGGSSPPSYPTSPGPTYPGGSIDLGGGPLDLGGSGPAGGSGSGPGSGGGGPGSGGGDPGVPGAEAPDDGGEGPLGSFAPSAAPLPMLPSQDSPLPDTFVFLGVLALLAAGLGAGFIRYRRRL